MLSAAAAKPSAGVANGDPFRLIAPYELNARKWEEIEWIDVHNPKAGPHRIATGDGRPGVARIDTFLDVVDRYETHPESKALNPGGQPCGRSTVGLLKRRHVNVGEIANTKSPTTTCHRRFIYTVKHPLGCLRGQKLSPWSSRLMYLSMYLLC